ncbi:MAG: hypothetical protein ACRBEQ_06315 [Hyphomonas sp.]
MRFAFLFFAALGLCGCVNAGAPQTKLPVNAPIISVSSEQSEKFGALAALAGTRWYAVPAEGASEKVGDLQHWYWEFGGTVLAQRHALEDGSYGGVTYIYPNTTSGELDFVYITSGGFHTSGAFSLNEDGSWTALEDVAGHETITQVRSMGRIDPDGTLQTRSEYLQSGKWVPGLAFSGAPTDRLVPAINTGNDD